LLVGPPGTGKTFESQQVKHKYLSSLYQVLILLRFVRCRCFSRDLSNKQKRKSPAIIDEIDAVGRARGAKKTHTKTPTTFLSR
jgi:ATP-dependent Zn protease